MNDEHTSTRLGDLLVERGVISRLQLAHAIEVQNIRRQHDARVNVPHRDPQGLGEILIELGYINRHQLTSGLNWQKRLRKTTAVMVFIAPLLTVACGGGSGASSGSVNTKAPDVSSQSISSMPDPESSISSSNPGSSALNASSAPSDVLSSDSPAVLSSSSNSAPLATSSSSSLAPALVSSSSISSTSSASSAAVDGSVQLYWRPPRQRENGAFLDITEIGGYEIRYKRDSEAQFTKILINDAYLDAYYFEYLRGNYEFQIAAFDVDGVYSAFVKINPR